MAAFPGDEMRYRNHLEQAFESSWPYAKDAIPSSSAAHGSTCHRCITQIILLRTFELQCAFVASKGGTDHSQCRRQHCTGPEFLPTSPLRPLERPRKPSMHYTPPERVHAAMSADMVACSRRIKARFTRHQVQVDHLARPGLTVLRAVIPRALETWLRSAF